MGRAKKVSHLYVYQNTQLMGQLERATTGAISFQYDPSWLDQVSATPISLSLPLQESTFRGAEVLSYFDNLLPDNPEIRKKVARRVKAESTSAYDLLSSIGQDCVGALQFLTEETNPQEKICIQGIPLSSADI